PFHSTFFFSSHLCAPICVPPPSPTRRSSDLLAVTPPPQAFGSPFGRPSNKATRAPPRASRSAANEPAGPAPTINTSNCLVVIGLDRKSTRLNSSHVKISYAVFCLKKKKKHKP